MINELLFMNGYAVYVMSAFGFTLLSFFGLYMITKLQFVKEQSKSDKRIKNYYLSNNFLDTINGWLKKEGIFFNKMSLENMMYPLHLGVTEELALPEPSEVKKLMTQMEELLVVIEPKSSRKAKK